MFEVILTRFLRAVFTNFDQRASEARLLYASTDRLTCLSPAHDIFTELRRPISDSSLAVAGTRRRWRSTKVAIMRSFSPTGVEWRHLSGAWWWRRTMQKASKVMMVLVRAVLLIETTLLTVVTQATLNSSRAQ